MPHLNTIQFASIIKKQCAQVTMNIITGGKLSHNRNVVVIRNSVRFFKVFFIVIWEYSTITHVPGTQYMLPA